LKPDSLPALRNLSNPMPRFGSIPPTFRCPSPPFPTGFWIFLFSFCSKLAPKGPPWFGFWAKPVLTSMGPEFYSWRFLFGAGGAFFFEKTTRALCLVLFFFDIRVVFPPLSLPDSNCFPSCSCLFFFSFLIFAPSVGASFIFIRIAPLHVFWAPPPRDMFEGWGQTFLLPR